MPKNVILMSPPQADDESAEAEGEGRSLLQVGPAPIPFTEFILSAAEGFRVIRLRRREDPFGAKPGKTG